MAPLVPSAETHVVIAGDWHANIGWVGKAVPAIAREAPGVRTILQVGDFGIWVGRQGRKHLDAVDFWCDRVGISRVLVTPGNHEDWNWLNSEFSAQPGSPVALSAVVEALPRGYRFEIGNRTFASFGGAASVDFEFRSPGINWFRGELPTEQDVALAISRGPADVLLTHETVNGGTPASESVLGSNPMYWRPEALDYSSHSRRSLRRSGRVKPRHCSSTAICMSRTTSRSRRGSRLLRSAVTARPGTSLSLSYRR